ncbi:helix-turn-helix domain-containing protein [Massilia sp. TS11]|uniref:helix-turn-helix domain-containing protein n=1 Tax=Massilia sp. TS11 TaxID=2908003 RepID=UPI001EDB1767|nr:helix-turn-helix domain-containing protein [Massilia sp. TS11]MCG2583831.1 helix-turn-helix domain-containing protein [Massilia sp. TS11]
MDIADVAKQTGVPASTLRYYEEKGLIVSLGRSGARRRFGPEVLQQLALIALGQAAGFSLDEIRSLILPGGAQQIDRARLRSKADEIDAQIARLSAVSRGLRHAARCPAPSHSDCPTFQKLLAAAARGLIGQPQTLGAGKKRSARARPSQAIGT